MKIVIFGTFYPIHIGHEYLISEAKKHSNSVEIITLINPKEKTLPFETRLFKSENNIVLYYDIEFLGNCVEAWGDFLAPHIRNKDLMIGADPFTQKVANHVHIIYLDITRTIDISSEAIRKNINSHWHFLSDSVKRILQKNIVILGTNFNDVKSIINVLKQTYPYAEDFNSENDLINYQVVIRSSGQSEYMFYIHNNSDSRSQDIRSEKNRIESINLGNVMISNPNVYHVNFYSEQSRLNFIKSKIAELC